MAGDVKVLVWITEAGWEAGVDAAAAFAGAETTLLYVPAGDLAPPEPLGRRRRLDVEARWTALSGAAAGALLQDAERRLGRAAAKLTGEGRPEDAVIAAAEDADVLVVVRDGRDDTPGPHSIGHATRFIVDHAPCTVMLAWP